MTKETLSSKAPELSKEEIHVKKLERRKDIREKHEEREKNIEQHKEEVKKEALEQAEISDRERHERNTLTSEKSDDERVFISGKQLNHSFNKQMNDIRSEMSPAARAFSRLIHTKTVEKTSELLGATVARPNALFTGSLFAFLSTIFFYFIAKNYGYQISGFEVIAAFLIGWTGGILYDLLKVMVTGKTSK